jgi:hypothetical protein
MGVKPHLDPQAVLAIQTINFRDDWASVRNALVVERTMFIDALNRPTMPEQRQALLDLDPAYQEVPDAFLAYVGGPGGQLLHEGARIDEYLYAGEASRSTANPLLLDLLPQVSRLRRMLREAVDDAGGVNSAALQPLLDAVTSCSSLAFSAVPGPVGQMVQMVLDEVKQDVAQLQSRVQGTIDLSDRSETQAWRTRQDERLHRAKRDLRAAYEAGSLTTSTGSASPIPEAPAPAYGIAQT